MELFDEVDSSNIKFLPNLENLLLDDEVGIQFLICQELGLSLFSTKKW